MSRVVIAGGGVMGWSTALFLKRLGHKGSVSVVERGGEDHSSTSRSAGGIRHQFTLRENIHLAQFGSEYLRGLEGTPLSAAFQERGYLFLASSDNGVQTLKTSNQLQLSCGAEVSLLEPAQIAKRWPYLTVDDVKLGAFGEKGEGWLDAHLLRSSFAIQAKSLGVEQAVTKGLLGSNGRVRGVELADGTTLECDVLVNALGPSCAELMRSIDPAFDLPVRRRKRCVFFFTCKSEMPRCPMVIDSSGVYFRPEGLRLVSTMTSHPNNYYCIVFP
jgi:FAD-dependent oxidoreductase domain-containing protein 1